MTTQDYKAIATQILITIICVPVLMICNESNNLYINLAGVLYAIALYVTYKFILPRKIVDYLNESMKFGSKINKSTNEND